MPKKPASKTPQSYWLPPDLVIDYHAMADREHMSYISFVIRAIRESLVTHGKHKKAQ